MTEFWKTLLSSVDYSSLPVKYVKLAECIGVEIDNGNLISGEPFPSMEKIAIETNLDKKTVNKAVTLLKARGKVYITDGAGVFVSNKENLRSSRRKFLPWFTDRVKLDFEEEHLGSFRLPFSKFDTGYLKLYTSNLPLHSDIDEVNAYQYLKEFLSSLLLHESCIRVPPEAVFGLQEKRAAMNILFRVLYSSGHGTLVMANPGCSKISDSAKDEGFTVLTVGVDKEGMKTSELEELCKIEVPAVVYVAPRCHFPSTTMMSNERREHLIQLKKQYGFKLIEFDSFIDITKNTYQPMAVEYADEEIIYVRPISTFGRWFSSVLMIVGTVDIVRELTSESKAHGVFFDLVMIKTLCEFWDFQDSTILFGKARRRLKERKSKFLKMMELQGLKKYVIEAEANDLCLYFNSPWLSRHLNLASLFNNSVKDEKLEELISSLKKESNP